MKKYVNHAVSMVTTGVFLAIALACFSGDGKNYAKDCELLMPSVSKTQMIKIVVVDKLTKLPLAGVEVDINYSKYEKVKTGINCELQAQPGFTKLGSTDISGMFTLSAGNTYYSSEDYIYGKVGVHLSGYYRDTNIGYFKLGADKNTETVHFSLLKINVSP
ncbi:MAG: hypothetical protein H7X99_07530 [Saprospiraceae bacterium]|nr:hypothetical protein [Saprospiraceae bacterium]